jgi:hypothetical protein
MKISVAVFSVVHFRIQAPYHPQPRCSGLLRRDFFLLNLAHDVHDAFVDMQSRSRSGNGPGFALRTLSNTALTIWLIDGHTNAPFQFADLVGGLRPLTQ